jgi:glutathione synthase/RimK-type ligase-like ATP-grasp enzyme
LKLKELQHTEVEFEVGPHKVSVPQVFVPVAEQLDALYTVSLSTALERVRENAAADAEEELQGELQDLSDRLKKCQEYNAALVQRCAEYATAQGECQALMTRCMDQMKSQDMHHAEQYEALRACVVDKDAEILKARNTIAELKEQFKSVRLELSLIRTKTRGKR